MARIRTIDGAWQELHQMDLGSAVSKRFIRQLVITGKIPSRRAGKKYLLDMDNLESYLTGEDLEDVSNG